MDPGRVVVVAEEGPVPGQGRPGRARRTVPETSVPPPLPPGSPGDRQLGLAGAAQERHPAGLVEKRLDLRRRIAARQGDEDRQQIRAVAGRVEERSADRPRDLDLRGQRPEREVVDDGQDVVGVRLGEAPEDGRVAGRLVGGAPWVHRVADVAHRREVAQDRDPGSIGDRRQVQTRLGRQVGDERRLAGRDRHDPGPARSDRPAETMAAGVELGRLEELIEVGAADDPGGCQGGIGHPVLTRQRAAVGHGGGLRLGGPTDLDREDRLAQLEGAVGQGEEPLRSLEPLDEEDDRVGLGIVQGIGQVVAQVQDDLRAAADDPAEADPGARMDERVGHAAALGDPGHPAAGQPGVDVADVERRVRGQVDHAHAVRSQDRQPVAEGDLPDVGLHPGGRLAALDHPAAGDEHDPGADVGRLLGHGGRPERVQGHQHRLGDLGQRGEVRIAGLAPGLGVLRVHEVAAGRAAHHGQVVPDRPGQVRSGRGPDDRDRGRGEERPEIDRRAIGGRDARSGHPWPTTRPTPRFSRARAMTIRWISLVPSQIRSTRSSRR